MTNMEKYLSLLNDEVDGLLLTSRYARHYGAEFDIAEGVAIVSKKGSRYFVDFRYIESAQKNLKHFEVLDINQFTGFIGRLKEAIADFGITTLGYEDNYITAAELHEYQAALDVKHETGKPKLILCHTVKGKGVSFMENQAGWHGKAPNAEQYAIARAELEAAIKELEEN